MAGRRKCAKRETLNRWPGKMFAKDCLQAICGPRGAILRRAGAQVGWQSAGRPAGWRTGEFLRLIMVGERRAASGERRAASSGRGLHAAGWAREKVAEPEAHCCCLLLAVVVVFLPPNSSLSKVLQSFCAPAENNHLQAGPKRANYPRRAFPPSATWQAQQVADASERASKRTRGAHKRRS